MRGEGCEVWRRAAAARCPMRLRSLACSEWRQVRGRCSCRWVLPCQLQGQLQHLSAQRHSAQRTAPHRPAHMRPTRTRRCPLPSIQHNLPGLLNLRSTALEAPPPHKAAHRPRLPLAPPRRANLPGKSHAYTDGGGRSPRSRPSRGRKRKHVLSAAFAGRQSCLGRSGIPNNRHARACRAVHRPPPLDDDDKSSPVPPSGPASS